MCKDDRGLGFRAFSSPEPVVSWSGGRETRGSGRTRVKIAVRMHVFPASGANLYVPPPIEIIRDTKTN